MDVYISIDGVLRDTIGKFEYHYNDYFLESDTEVDDSFEYRISRPIFNDDLSRYFKFQSSDEFNNFTYIEFPLEIFGHAFNSYSLVFLDLNKLIHEHKDVNFTVVGFNEKGRAKSASLFFLSKNNFLGNNVKFITSKNLKKEWKNCDLWITDNEEIMKAKPIFKKAVEFKTPYNKHISPCYTKHRINELKEIEKLCLKSSDKIITLIWTRLLRLVGQETKSKTMTEKTITK